jgi:hypothetical protein
LVLAGSSDLIFFNIVFSKWDASRTKKVTRTLTIRTPASGIKLNLYLKDENGYGDWWQHSFVAVGVTPDVGGFLRVYSYGDALILGGDYSKCFDLKDK